MITLRKPTLRKIAFLIVGLLITALGLAFSPVFDVLAVDTCGNGVCDRTENSDSCLADCNCVDNGIVDPGEGCSCKDAVCEGEGLITACGTHCGPNGECPGGLVCANGDVCWDGEVCAPLKPVVQPPSSKDKNEGGGPACLPDGSPCEPEDTCCSGVCDGICFPG